MGNDLKDRMYQRAAQRSEGNLKRLSGMAARLETVVNETAVAVARKDIERDPAIQVRVGGLNEEKVVEYMTIIENGGEMPPIVLFRDEKTDKLYLADGFHRDEAEGRLGHEEVRAEIRPGGYAAAIEYAEEANMAHGLHLSYADKRNIFERRCRRGHEWATASDGSIARQLGVDRKTIGNWRSSLTGEISPVRGNEGRKAPEKRVGVDGRSYRVPPSGSKPTKPEPPAAIKPERPQVSQDEIARAIISALADGDLVWHELLRAVKSMVGGEVEPPAFNQALRALLDMGRVVPSQRDQAAFALPDTAAKNDSVSNLDQKHQPMLDWDRSASRQLMLLLNDLLALQDADLESEFTLLTQKTADKLRRNMATIREIMLRWEGWLA